MKLSMAMRSRIEINSCIGAYPTRILPAFRLKKTHMETSRYV